jgi:hypothetical protein
MRVSQKVHRRLRVRARHELGYCIVQERPGVLRGQGCAQRVSGARREIFFQKIEKKLSVS